MSEGPAQTIDKETGKPSGKPPVNMGEFTFKQFSPKEKRKEFETVAKLKINSATEQMVQLMDKNEKLIKINLPYIRTDLVNAKKQFDLLYELDGDKRSENYARGIETIITGINGFLENFEEKLFSRFLNSSVRYLRSIRYRTKVTVSRGFADLFLHPLRFFRGL